jgi:hypothetical protein
MAIGRSDLVGKVRFCSGRASPGYTLIILGTLGRVLLLDERAISLHLNLILGLKIERLEGVAWGNRRGVPNDTLSWQNEGTKNSRELDFKSFQALFPLFSLSLMNYPG